MNTNLLKSKMVEHGDTQAVLASAIGISASNFNDKVNGKVSFRQRDIAAIRSRYHLSAEEVDLIFFNSGCPARTI
ncbi:MAG: DUF739 family protein [Mogibacterium sp.]|nr:DUF739 family protein [Mogibacterium sp.]